MTFATLFALFLLVCLVVALVIRMRALAKQRAEARNPPLCAPATIIDKRFAITKGDFSTTTGYHTTFEFEGGERLELIVPVTIASALIVGDYGTLVWSGVTFREFRREILR